MVNLTILRSFATSTISTTIGTSLSLSLATLKSMLSSLCLRLRPLSLSLTTLKKKSMLSSLRTMAFYSGTEMRRVFILRSVMNVLNGPAGRTSAAADPPDAGRSGRSSDPPDAGRLRSGPWRRLRSSGLAFSGRRMSLNTA